MENSWSLLLHVLRRLKLFEEVLLRKDAVLLNIQQYICIPFRPT